MQHNEGKTGPTYSIEHIIAAARTIMVRARFAFLTTIYDGKLQTRLMDPFEPETDLTIWMATNSHTRKLVAIRAGSAATLAYTDGAGDSYVALTGSIQILEDLSEKTHYSRYWKAVWHDFYEDEWRGRDYALMKLTPNRVEIMSAEFAIAMAAKGFRPAILVRNAEGWQLD